MVCYRRGELRDKTVVLATNQLQFVADADLILYLADGQIAESGTYDELISAGAGFAALMKEAQVRACDNALLLTMLQ